MTTLSCRHSLRSCGKRKQEEDEYGDVKIKKVRIDVDPPSDITDLTHKIKLVHESGANRGLQFQVGLIKDVEEMDDAECGRGLYFTTLEHLGTWYQGTKKDLTLVYDVEVPHGECVLYFGDKSKAFSLQLSNPRHIREVLRDPVVALAAVKQNGLILEHVPDPSEEVQLAAVKQNGYAIQFIQNPSVAVQLEAVKRNGYALKFILRPSEALQLAAVRQNGQLIKYIQNPSEAVQLEATGNCGLALYHIQNPSEAVQLEAVKQKGLAIEYIRDPSEEVQLAAVKQDGYAIQHIKNPSAAVQLESERVRL